MNKKTTLIFLCFISIKLFLFADDAQTMNENIKKISKYKETNDYDSMIKLISEEIKNGNIYPIYFDILGGAYDAKKDKENAYLSYLKGFLYNPSHDYSRKNLLKRINYLENRRDELEKESWLYKYLLAKKAFDDSNLDDAEKKISLLMGEGKNLDILCIINKDIKSLKDVPKESKTVMGNLTAAESTFNKVIAEMGSNCPEYVFYEYADLLFKAGKYELALEKYQISFAKNHFRRDNQLKFGACQLYTKKYSEAKQTFTQCTDKMPDYAEAHLFLGYSLWALKESEKAIKSFKTVVEMCQTSNTALRDKAKKSIEVVMKGDLFLTPEDMNKLMPNEPTTQKPTKETPDKLDKKGQEKDDKPVDQK